MEHASLLGKGPLIKKKKSKCRGIGVFREWVRLRKTSNDITKKQKHDKLEREHMSYFETCAVCDSASVVTPPVSALKRRVSKRRVRGKGESKQDNRSCLTL